MSRHGNDQSVETRDFVVAACLFGLCLVAISTPACAGAQDRDAAHRIRPPADRPRDHPQPSPGVTPGVPMGRQGLNLGPVSRRLARSLRPKDTARQGPPALDPKVQVVRFQGPRTGGRDPGTEPSPAPIGDVDGEGIATVGLQRAVGYRLRLSHITERPGVELFPVIEVVGTCTGPGRSARPSPDPDRLHR